MNQTTKPPRTVKCPECGKPAVYAPENRFRPFCSERCKLIDIGAWASESYRVVGEEEPLPDEQGPGMGSRE